MMKMRGALKQPGKHCYDDDYRFHDQALFEWGKEKKRAAKDTLNQTGQAVEKRESFEHAPGIIEER